MLDLAIRGTKFIWIKLDLPIITMGVANERRVQQKKFGQKIYNNNKKIFSHFSKLCFVLNIFRMFSSQHVFF